MILVICQFLTETLQDISEVHSLHEPSVLFIQCRKRLKQTNTGKLVSATGKSMLQPMLEGLCPLHGPNRAVTLTHCRYQR